MAVSLLPEGRGILRGGFGKFAERTPLTVGAFTQYQVADGHADSPPRRRRSAPPVTFAHVIDGALQTPESLVETVAWDQRFGRAVLLQGGLSAPDGVARLHRSIPTPAAAADAVLHRAPRDTGRWKRPAAFSPASTAT